MMKIDVETMRISFLENDTLRDAGLTEPASIERIKNISYGPFGNDNLCDIYFPKETSTKLPTIVSIHGGGYFYGDKEIYRFYTMFLATQGFTVVNFNYRLAPSYKFPSTLEDINQLMTWLVKHNCEYQVDLDNLFIVGDSAGGQLAEQYCAILSNPSYAKLFDFDVPEIKVKAVALNCGCYFIGNNEAINQNFPYYFDESVDDRIQNQFPVESFITSDFPPSFVMTSSGDFLKDLAPEMAKLLIEKQVPVVNRIYENDDLSDLEHVFHMNQKTEIARKCNMDELDFFKSYIN